MRKYIVKRLLLFIPILLGVVFIVFAIMAMTPGSPGMTILGANANPADIDALNEELGYNRPFLVRYADYLWDALHGNFGNSYRTMRPVFNEIFSSFRYTVLLSVLGTVVSYVIGIPLGILSAVKQYSLVDVGTTVLAMFFAAVPGFWLALLLILLFCLRLGWLPPNGVDTWRHFILPVAVVALPSAAITSRMTRTTMLEAIRQDYIRTARSKGLPESVVLWKHAFQNAMLPIVTSLIVSFGASLGGTVLIENIFSIPGIGNLVLTAIRQKDVPQVMAATIFLSSIYCAFVLIADLAVVAIDPRVKAVYLKKGKAGRAK